MSDRDLTEMERLDQVSREQWSIAAAEMLIYAISQEALVAIATRGFDEFLRVSRPTYHDHGFHYDDYKRMFGRIQRVAAERATGPRH